MQTWLAKNAARQLSAKIGAQVTINRINIRLFNRMEFNGLMVADRHKDTLLYAGKAKMAISNWFFLKDKATISYLQLDKAEFNFHRTDSIWNYQFILDYFDTPTNKNKEKNKIELNINSLRLTHVVFNKKDAWIGQDQKISAKDILVNMDKIDYVKKQILVKDINLISPIFAQSDYTGNRLPQPNLSAILKRIPITSALRWNNSGWQVRVSTLKIKDGIFQNDKETVREPYDDRFDGQHILFYDINGSIKNLSAIRDTFSGHIQVSAQEKCGLIVKEVNADMRFTPVLMEFNNLTLKTNRSELGNYYSMKYDSFNKDMANFISDVVLTGHFKNSIIHSNDIAFFAPELKKWNRLFNFEGNATGTVEDFIARDMKIKSGMSYLEGDFAMKGLPDIDSTIMKLDAKTLATHYFDLINFFPAIKDLKTPRISALGKLYFIGQASGSLYNFTTTGNFRSDIGAIGANQFNINLSKKDDVLYNGKLQTQQFNIGQFLNNNMFGKISLDGNINGKALTLNKLKVNYDGHISSVAWNNKTFSNLDITGDFEKRFFRGHFTIDDPKIKIRTLDGTVSLIDKEMNLNADADIDFIDLQQLGIVKKDLRMGGKFNMNFTGNTIDHFMGVARVYDANLISDSIRLSFDSLSLSSYLEGDKKTLTLHSNEIDAQLKGNYTIMDLPNAFRFFFSRYFPAYIEKPDFFVNNQDFTFNIHTRDVESYLPLIHPQIKGLNHANVDGKINLIHSILDLNAFIPEFSLGKRTFQNINIDGDGDMDTLRANIDVERIVLSDSLQFPKTNLKLKTNNNYSWVQLTTSASKNINNAQLNAGIETMPDGVQINLFPSSIILNEKEWLLENNGELTIRKNFINANEIKFKHENEEIAILSELSDETDQAHLIANLKNVTIEDIAPLVIQKPKLAGKLTGTATLFNPFGKTSLAFIGEAENFYLNKKRIGDVNLEANADILSGDINYRANARDTTFDFDLEGNYNYKDSLRKLVVNLDGQKINLEVLEPYLNTIFTSIKGTATANLQINGTPGHLYLVGEATIDSAEMMVDYTQCKYTLKDETVYFRPDEIDLGRMDIYDTLGNQGVVSGRMTHQFFDNFNFHQVNLETQKLLLLNTSRKNNEQFYGNLIGYAKVSLNGPLAGMVMTIDGQPSSTDSSRLFLPTEDSKESSSIDYIDFVQYGTLPDERKKTNVANMLVIMNVNANPSCQVDVILDEATGDIISGQGNGLLNIRVGTKEPLSIRGRYELVKGEYTFNFQTFLHKPFTLNRGSITWNGDPYQAIIDIEAEYIAKNVDVSILASAGGYRQKEDVTIISHLTGILQQPVIEFEFKLPEKSEIKNDYIAVKKLADFQNDKAEMNKQVASLLLFNSFISSGQSFLSAENTLSIATNTIGGIMSGWLTNIFNKELEKATHGIITSYIDINPTLNLQTAASQLQANVRAGLKVLLSKRLFILIGGNLEYNNPATLQLSRRGLLTPDITIEWLLNKDGTLRVVGFNRTSIDLTAGQRNRSGIQLSYRKNYNRLWEIFMSRKRIEAREEKYRNTLRTEK